MPQVSSDFLRVTVDSRKKNPIYLQLYEWFRNAIVGGRLRPGQRLPSTRGLAAELGVSRISVFNAYEQLQAEGYLDTFVGAGTHVAKSIPDEAVAIKVVTGQKGSVVGGRPRLRRLSDRGTAWKHVPAQSWLDNLGPFRVSLPALNHFPIELWSKLVSARCSNSPIAAMAYGDAKGYLPFREAVAEYLNTVRGVRCHPSQILVTTGSQQGLQISAQVLLNPGDRLLLEEPGYPGARYAFATAGFRLVPIRVDRDGISVEEITRKGRNARAVYVTPSHQYPMGVTMSAARRMLLLNWATRSGAWIIEDDYDSEYRFESRPIASLQGLDTDERVIYVGTFNKVMFPALRLGYVVVPTDLVSAFSAARDAADIFSATLYQAALTDFIREGHFARHIRRMRVLYMSRRKALVDAIQRGTGEILEVVGSEAGMHLVALLPPGMDDVGVSREAANRGISAMPLSVCFTTKPARGGLILGYGGVNNKQIREGVEKLRMSILSRKGDIRRKNA